MKKEENVVSILQEAVHFLKIKVTDSALKEFLLQHPYYPSLKSVCDALNKWNVENYALNLDQDEIRALEMPFIAHLKHRGGQLAFVEKIKNGEVRYTVSKQKSIKEDFVKFSEKLSGAVIVMEAGKNSGDKEYREKHQDEILKKSLFPLGIISLLFLATNSFVLKGTIILQPGYLYWGLLFSKITGLVASVILVLHELKISTPLADKICGFSSKTDCDTVLSSNASKLFGWINWADIGLIYFTGTFLFLVGTKSTSGLWFLALISAVSLPYPVFSIYYQTFKVKKWCPFCLLVQLVLIVEFVLLLPALYLEFITVVNFLHLLVSFLVPASLWLIFKAFYIAAKEKTESYYSHLQFKRNPEVFRFLLTKEGYNEINITENSLVLGNPKAQVTITAFLSLYCNPCAKAFTQLKELLNNCQEVKINAIFSVYNDEESKRFINTLYFISQNKEQEKAIDFLYKWYTMPVQNRELLYEQEQLPAGFDVTDTIGQKNKALFDIYKILGTPAVFINGYQYPAQQYNYSEIEFYIDDIKQINLESKRQEACTNCN